MLCAFFEVGRTLTTGGGGGGDDESPSTAISKAPAEVEGFRVKTKHAKPVPRASAPPPQAAGRKPKSFKVPKGKESSTTTLHAPFQPLPDDDGGETPDAFPDAYTRDCGVLDGADPEDPQQQGEWEYVYDDPDAEAQHPEEEEDDIIDTDAADTETDGSWAYDDTDPEPSPAAQKSSKAALAKSWEEESGCDLLTKWRIRRKAETEAGASHTHPVYAGPELCLDEEDF